MNIQIGDNQRKFPWAEEKCKSFVFVLKGGGILASEKLITYTPCFLKHNPVSFYLL